jgi:hypothetical protein
MKCNRATQVWKLSAWEVLTQLAFAYFEIITNKNFACLSIYNVTLNMRLLVLIKVPVITLEKMPSLGIFS